MRPEFTTRESPCWAHSLNPDLWDVAQIFWQRQDDRHLEEACRLWLDDLSAVCVEKHPDLLLGGGVIALKARMSLLTMNPCGFFGNMGFSAKARSWR